MKNRKGFIGSKESFLVVSLSALFMLSFFISTLPQNHELKGCDITDVGEAQDPESLAGQTEQETQKIANQVWDTLINVKNLVGGLVINLLDVANLFTSSTCNNIFIRIFLSATATTATVLVIAIARG